MSAKRPHSRLQRALLLGLMLWSCLLPVIAEQDPTPPAAAEPPPQTRSIEERTLKSLADSLQLQKTLRARIKSLSGEIKGAVSEASKKQLEEQLGRLQAELDSALTDFNYLATGTDNHGMLEPGNAPFDFQEEFFALLKPAMDELKDMTSGVRKKSDLRERITYYNDRLPVANKALNNVNALLQQSSDAALQSELKALQQSWEKQVELISGRLESSKLQLQRLQAGDQSIGSMAESYFKSFFQRRGLYLMIALVAVATVMIVSRLLHLAMEKLIPSYRAIQRSFRLRLFDLSYRLLTILLMLAAPLLVFYYVEDWLLLSLGILFLIGIGWTLTKTLPVYWAQVQLFLNIGSVREGERIDIGGLPWRVRRINLFTELENSEAGLRQRIPIGELIEMRSRPVRDDEPWFPVQRNDWALLADGFFGKVTGISLELVELTDLGGSTKSYSTTSFLDNAPVNLSRNFRISQTFGISYDLQADATTDIPKRLEDYLQQQLALAGFTDGLIKVQVEFQLANTSSLDLLVIADFTGEMARHYNRLGRAIQRWCVEAATRHGWEIPFTQITLHQAKA